MRCKLGRGEWWLPDSEDVREGLGSPLALVDFPCSSLVLCDFMDGSSVKLCTVNERGFPLREACWGLFPVLVTLRPTLPASAGRGMER